MVLKKKGSKTRPISALPLCGISIAKSQILAQWTKASVPHLHQDCGLQLWLSTNYAAHLEMYFMGKKVGSFLSSIQRNSARLVVCVFNDQNFKNFLCIGWHLPSPTFLLQSSLHSSSALCTQSCVKIQHLKPHTMLQIPVPLFTSLPWDLTAGQFTSVSFHGEIRIEARLILCDCCEEQISWYVNALTQCLMPVENHTV